MFYCLLKYGSYPGKIKGAELKVHVLKNSISVVFEVAVY